MTAGKAQRDGIASPRCRESRWGYWTEVSRRKKMLNHLREGHLPCQLTVSRTGGLVTCTEIHAAGRVPIDKPQPAG